MVKILNHILSLLGLNKNHQAAANLNVDSKSDDIIVSRGHLRTLYRIGPSYITYKYRVDEAPLKEIYDKKGKIGPSRYSRDALKNIREYDNEWFLFHDYENGLLVEDLLKLATRHKMYGAYSLLGSLNVTNNQKLTFLSAGSQKGCVKCMVHYGMELCREGKLEDGFMWLKRGADNGDDLGCLYVGIAYNYGTLCEMNYELAAEYYLKAIEANREQYWAYVNLGVLLVQSGYYHTALRYFKEAKDGITADYDDYNENRDADDLMSDYEACLELLRYKYEERRNWYVVQAHSPKLDCIFCSNYEAIGRLNERSFTNPKKWIPKVEQLEIDSKDSEEMRNAVPMEQVPVNRDEDFIFPTYLVKVNNRILYCGAKELVFIEKFCHADLNNYIKEKIIQLRASFKELGYSLVYLPAKSFGVNDVQDTIDWYVLKKSDLDPYFKRYSREINESDYWNGIVDDGCLPIDCAGFLRCPPNQPEKLEQIQFEFIQFPFRPGTDWPRAFDALLDFLKHKETPSDVEKATPHARKILPEGSCLIIDEEYEVSLRDKDGEMLAKIELTPLPKVMLFALLNHPEGLVIKNLFEIKDELYSYYRAIMKGKGIASMKNIETLVDPTDNSANEKISRIRAAFKKAMEYQYKDDLPLFLPQGKRGEAYSIGWNRERVKYF